MHGGEHLAQAWNIASTLQKIFTHSKESPFSSEMRKKPSIVSFLPPSNIFLWHGEGSLSSPSSLQHLEIKILKTPTLLLWEEVGAEPGPPQNAERAWCE